MQIRKKMLKKAGSCADLQKPFHSDKPQGDAEAELPWEKTQLANLYNRQQCFVFPSKSTKNDIKVSKALWAGRS